MSVFAGNRYHFIGAGGIGMSGLAKVLLRQGAIVTGSDQEDSAVVKQLRSMGADIKIGHSAENLPVEIDAAVISAAITARNPELAAAGERGIMILKYAEMLGFIMEQYRGIAVAGTHGKSTTSGWLAFVMERAGAGPNFIVGADIPQLSSSSGVGAGKYFVAEACEYDRSFLNLHPEIGIILNIEQDHLDYYRDVEEIIEAFADFAGGLRAGGKIIVNGQDKNVAKALDIAKAATDKIVTFGMDGKFDFSARNVELAEGFWRFDMYRGDRRVGTVRISLPGEHNIMNALATAAAAINAGVDEQRVMELLPEFEGTDRRLMLRGRAGGVIILDDYAHHPTEIKASLAAIRSRYNPKRLWCVFQPHQYSRTRFLLDDFAESFKLADITVVPEIYFVRDTDLMKEKVNSQVLVERIRQSGSEAIFINDFEGIVEHLLSNTAQGDLVVTMGAGTIWKVADEYIRRLGADS